MIRALLLLALAGCDEAAPAPDAGLPSCYSVGCSPPPPTATCSGAICECPSPDGRPITVTCEVRP